MSTTDIVVSEENLTITLDNGQKETYSMTEIPAPTTGLVLAAKQEILQTVNLRSMLNDLDQAADLIYLAYNGVVGTGNLAASVHKKQSTLADLCADCVNVMQGFVTVTNDILNRLVEAYEFLLDVKEDRAMKVLSRCAKSATAISLKCGELAKRFEDLKDETVKDASSAEVAVGDQNKRKEELIKLRADLEAALAKQVQVQKDYTESLEELNTKIADATAREDKESERAFITGLVGGLAGALGAGLGAYASAKSPLANTGGGQAGGNQAAPTPGPDLNQGQKAKDAEVADKQKAFDATDTAFQKAQKDRDAKKTAFDKCDEAGKAIAQKELDAADAALVTAQKDRDKANEALATAKSRSVQDYAAASAGAAAAGSVANTANNMSNAAEARAEGIRSERARLIDAQMAQQKGKREAAAQMAELGAKLTGNAKEVGVAESALRALQISVWALHNINVALLNAQTFWSNLSSFCQRLSESSLLASVSEESTSSDTEEERREYYLGKRFMATAIGYTVRWSAVNAICKDYLAAANHTYVKVCDNIKSSPSIEEAAAQLTTLKQRFEERQAENERTISKTMEALDEQKKFLERY